METKVSSILDETDAPVDPGLVEDCHRLSSKGNPRKVILKLNRHKDAKKVLLNKKNEKRGSRNSELVLWHKNLHK